MAAYEAAAEVHQKLCGSEQCNPRGSAVQALVHVPNCTGNSENKPARNVNHEACRKKI